MTGTSPKIVSQKEALQNLVLDGDLERLEDLLAEFNLFDVLKIERREAQHSALLAWLLDPRGSHGLRDYFLRRFLSQVAAEAYERGITDITPLDVDRWNLDNIEVVTERHNIDVLLIGEADEFVCLIENKIGAGEHSNQLARYFELVKREYEGLVPFPIFLTPDGREPESEDDAERYVPFDYGSVATLIERTLKTRGSTMSDSVAGLLEQYARTLRRHVLDSADNIDELALQIYNKHRTAIDLIINAMPALEATAWNVIHKAIEQYAPRFEVDSTSKNYHQFYTPEIDEIPHLNEGSGWTASGRILLFQVNYRQGRFVLQIGPGPDKTRTQLYQLAQRDDGVPGVDMRRARSLSQKWHTIYSKPLLTKGGAAIPDYEKGRKEVEQAIEEFYKNDYWPIINAIRTEFGLKPVPPLPTNASIHPPPNPPP